MKKYILLFAVVSMLFSCANEEKSPTTNSDVKITHSSLKAENGEMKNVAQIQVEGMMCEMACVSKVKKELEELGCVTSVEIDFDSNKAIDVAVVEYKETDCNEYTMIDKIHSIGDGMYQVKSVDVQSFQ